MSSVNVKLLRKVQAHIVAHPEQVNMGEWTDCGTVGCIAFHTCVLSGKSSNFLGVSIGVNAEVFLGLDAEQGEALFTPNSESSLLIYVNPGTPEHARRVSEHIDRFIAEYAPEDV